MTPALYMRIRAARAAARRRPFHRLGAHRFRFGELLLIVVDGCEPVVGIRGVRIDLERLLVRRLGCRVVLFRPRRRADADVALGALRDRRDHLVEFRDRFVVLAGIGERRGLGVGRFDAGDLGLRFGTILLRHPFHRGAALGEREVHFRHVEADAGRLRRAQPFLSPR